MAALQPLRKQWFYRGLVGSLLTLSCGCSEVPPDDTPDSNLEGGIWMLTEVTRTREGTTDSCRPMLMEIAISSTTVTMSQRAFPCGAETTYPDALTLQRNGSALVFDGENVGSLQSGSMDITLPAGAGKISWNLDRTGIQWQETATVDGVSAVYSAKLELRPDNSPVVFPLDISALEDTPVIGRLHAAARPEFETSYYISSEPEVGYLDFFKSETGEFRLIPAGNFAGHDSFRFFAQNDELRSGGATVNIDYMGTPDPPIANPSFPSVLEDSSITFVPDVFDPDGDPLTLTLTTLPTHGTLSAQGLTLTYTPEPDFNGLDSMTYVVSDGSTTVGPASIEISVSNVNDPPVAVDQDLTVTSGSATPIVLQFVDKDSTDFAYWWESQGTLGELVGYDSSYVYVPNPGVQQGTEDIRFYVFDRDAVSEAATLHVTISPGSHPCVLQTNERVTAISPELTVGDKLYYRQRRFGTNPLDDLTVAVTNGAGSSFVRASDPETFGFDNGVGGAHRTTFFNMLSTVYFTTSTLAYATRFYRTYGESADFMTDIPAPTNDVASEPAVGEAYADDNVAYLPIHWRTTTSHDVCQVWKIDRYTSQTTLIHAFPSAPGPCFGLWTSAGEQYMFVGPNLYEFSGMQAPPMLIATLGDALPRPWMVEVGGKLFFQTRTPVGTDTQIDLWITDGTTAGTKVVKRIETTFFEFDIFSPVAFMNKLYFAHRKSLWSSDGTEAGTNIVATMPVGSAVGDGAIGKISILQDQMFFLANSDAAGREPWVSDGTTAGTRMLGDIRSGTAGSSLPSTNPKYFHAWNGQMFFLANDGAGSALWSTDGTSAGTKLVVRRPMVTIAEVLGDKLLFHDGHFFYAMLP